ncbi:MAG: metallophosphoesterase family protein [Gaiellaceae bacterium]
MRIAVVSDVHGNLPALEAVLAEVRDVDALVCCGDVEGEPCASVLTQAGARFVRGNADVGVDWPLTLELEVDGLGRVLFCHGSPRSEHEILTRVSPESRVQEALDGVDAAVVVHGHTHVQYDREVAGRRLVCPGSVGMPHERTRGAFWAMLGPAVEFRRTEYEAAPEPRDPDEVSAYFEGLAAGA